MVHEARYKRQKATPALITFLARTSHPFERVRGARGEESDVFSDAVDKAEAAVEAKRAPEEDMPGVQTTTGSELRGREEDVGEEKKKCRAAYAQVVRLWGSESRQRCGT